MRTPVHPDFEKGRGAASGGVSSRFGLPTRETDGDWRDHVVSLDGPPVKLRTTVTEERPKSILTFNTSPDVPFDRSINAYRGCEHGYTPLVASNDRFRALPEKGLMSDYGWFSAGSRGLSQKPIRDQRVTSLRSCIEAVVVTPSRMRSRSFAGSAPGSTRIWSASLSLMGKPI